MTKRPDSNFGNWPTPITSTLVAGVSISVDEPYFHGSHLWWLERRPDQGGRIDIKHHHQGATTSYLPLEFSCRSRVHEYGGGSYCATSNGVYFVNDHDQGIYFLNLDRQLRTIIVHRNTRYADLQVDTHRNQLICVQEQHIENMSPINSLVAIDLDTLKTSVLADGYDFYASPRLSPNGSQLAWLCWNHPAMPWDAAELRLADLNNNGSIGTACHIAGGSSVSVFQPDWSPQGVLHFIDDSSGWWNLYCHTDGNRQPLFNSCFEFGLPQWVFAQSSYAFINDHEIVCSYLDAGKNKLAILDCQQNTLKELDSDLNCFSSIHTNTGRTCFIGASDTLAPHLLEIDPHSYSFTSICNNLENTVDSRYFSRPRAIEFTTRHGDSAHAFYYPPHNPDISIDPDLKPPLIVITHGGPTSRSDDSLDIKKQFWTSRGYALLDVNYSGSTGFGREYRNRLYGQWGLRDAEDCCDAALHMVKEGLADPDRLIIKGSSAGGYTVLCALTFHEVFSAGASYYGIGELEALARHTHKFEAHYLDQLIGPYPEMRDIYQQRSPLNHVEQLSCPVIFFQGLEDKVVPPEQSEMMFNALKEKGIATSYLTFSGEAHGFRKAETITTCLRAELEFYARVLNLPLDDECGGELVIENQEPS